MIFAAMFAAISALNPQISLLDANGKAFSSSDVSFSVSCISNANGAIVSRCRLKALAGMKSPLKLRISARIGKSGGSLKAFDGRTAGALRRGAFHNPLVYKPSWTDGFGMFGAVWDSESGIALGTGADGEDSFVELETVGSDSGAVMTVTVNAALMHPGAEYECSVVAVPFDPKYGERDALARYYALYPERFKRNPRVNKEVFGICASYQSWVHSDPEMCRWADATWDWCIGSCRHWGDILNVDVPAGIRNKGSQEFCKGYAGTEIYWWRRRNGQNVECENFDMTRDGFNSMLKERYANAYYCGVINGCYMMAMSNISKSLADRYPDSLETGNPVYPNPYPFSTYVWAFPECSWGRELRRQIAERMRRDDFGCIAFDVSAAGGIYRGVRLKEMRNVGWDAHGFGVARGIANGKICDFVSGIPSKKLKGNIASAVNTCPGQLNDMLHADMVMIEQPPWYAKPPYPQSFRYAAGEKGITFWEGYDPRSLDPNFFKWSKREQHTLLRDLSRYAVHQEFRWGVSLPASFLTEYVSRMARAFSMLNEAGWKPVPGAIVPDGFDVARYGLGECSYLAVNNLEKKEARCDIRLSPQELHDGTVTRGRSADAVLFAPFFGGIAVNTVQSSDGGVSCNVGPLLTTVLEGVGTSRGNGDLQVSWSGDFSAVKLTFASKGFSGRVFPRSSFGTYTTDAGEFCLSAGEVQEIVYENGMLKGQEEAYRRFPFSGNLTLVRAADEDSKDIAERIAFFYRKAANRAVPISVDDGLPCRTVRFISPDGKSMFSVSADDRIEFSVIARRLLNAVNERFYPEYRHGIEMLPEERRHFTFMRN